MLVNLLAEMSRFKVTVLDVAAVLGIEKRAVKNRLAGRVEISAEDLKTVRDHFFPFYSLDYLISEEPIVVEPMEMPA